MAERGIDKEHYAWYRDLRRYGTVPMQDSGSVSGARSPTSPAYRTCATRYRSRAHPATRATDPHDLVYLCRQRAAPITIIQTMTTRLNGMPTSMAIAEKPVCADNRPPANVPSPALHGPHLGGRFASPGMLLNKFSPKTVSVSTRVGASPSAARCGAI